MTKKRTKKGAPLPPITIHDIPDKPTNTIILTPRSSYACSSEGIDIVDLLYRPVEAFADGQLSPRLVKLRYDFYEAKRKDLLTAAKLARDKLIPSTKGGGGSDDDDALRQSYCTVQLERHKLNRIQQHERRWLESTLGHELNMLKEMENSVAYMEAEDNSAADKMADDAAKMKELNDKRREREEAKQAEAEAQSRLEKEMAKREFLRQQQELMDHQKKEEERKQALHEKSLAEAERRRKQEYDKMMQQEYAWRLQQDKLNEMNRKDEERLRIQEEQKEHRQEYMRSIIKKKNDRVMASMKNNEELEIRRKQEYLDRLEQEEAREQRLEERRRYHHEEGSKRSLALALKRKHIINEAVRRQEERRKAILDHQQETEQRLLEHEIKRERYLAFKRELDALKNKNKEMNVMRQRRREEHKRNTYAVQSRIKNEKSDNLIGERNRLWEERRQTGLEAYRARELIKSTIMDMKVKSKLSSGKLEKVIKDILRKKRFSPDASSSTPAAALLNHAS
ncbi:hypothetical protein FOZ63_031262 [Perkinsus olseni]|uniref:Uncharacterized protein n=1 Tax=Perkinsus olseni TaxID=32597 RepID=A0A7J6RXW2_PEROL|nr:hypothetical protein FOZ63_031262 [Perkinsus olseni]